MRFLIVMCVVLLSVQAQAGPWPRDAGAGFLSFSAEYDKEDDTVFTAIYAEYGITSRITTGLDLGFADDALYKAVIFARYPLNPPDAEWKVAAEMGVGAVEDEAMLRPGFHIGRGLKLGKRSGWFTIEALGTYEVEQDNVEFSTDITFGLNMTNKHKVLLQLQSGNQPMDPDYLNLATSVVVEQAPGLHFELGMKTGLKDEGDLALKLGLWRSF